MPRINLDNRQFRTFENSDHGAASDQTIFYYSQVEDLVTASYKGGGVRDGQILATWRSDGQLEMRYHCIMEDDVLKAGKAIANAKVNDRGLIELHLDWEWLGESTEKGKSIYIEFLESK